MDAVNADASSVSLAIHAPFWRILKAVFDRIGALFGLVIFCPVFLIAIFKIRRDGGPAFYAHERIGKNGIPFKCWKFRSMSVNGDGILKQHLEENPESRKEWEADFKLRDDPRVTPIGKFLRKTSLDELPQFWNVLKGEMSLVGPRPVIEEERVYYAEAWADYLSVKPGLTGLWQVSGRNDIGYEQRVAFDSQYIREWSLLKDISILLKTVTVVIRRDGAY